MNKKLFLLALVTLFFSCSEGNEVPIYDYYKNIPVLRGWTIDPEPRNYMIEVVLVYRENNSDLRTKINQLKPNLIDALRLYFSQFTEEDFEVVNQDRLKREAVLLLNDIILNSMTPKKADQLRGITDLEELDLLLDINIMQLQIFTLN